jgi:hypothetical protein
MQSAGIPASKQTEKRAGRGGAAVDEWFGGRPHAGVYLGQDGSDANETFHFSIGSVRADEHPRFALGETRPGLPAARSGRGK